MVLYLGRSVYKLTFPLPEPVTSIIIIPEVFAPLYGSHRRVHESRTDYVRTPSNTLTS
jgi:hypothetical protein